VSRSLITGIELIHFSYRSELPDTFLRASRYKPAPPRQLSRTAVAIVTNDGFRGEYVGSGNPVIFQQASYLAGFLLGRDAEAREGNYDDLKREIRQFDHMGYGALDIALWDLAGKKYGCSVAKLLGAHRQHLPAYASTFHGDSEGRLDSAEAYADFAEYCYELGYRAFKIHGWNAGDRRREAQNVLHMADRVGGRMDLMLDPACELRTFGDALYVGRACDEAGYYWYEDPFRDCGTSAFAHKKLRQAIKTPLLITEHVRGIEPKADFVLAGGTDFIRADPDYDLGITGALKIARFAEALGLDVEYHGCGPAQRHCMAATRNSNFYELSLVGPGDGWLTPYYAGDYSDALESISPEGTFIVPSGPGLGVSHNWDFIRAHATETRSFGSETSISNVVTSRSSSPI
jgi:L-alanine-DL-glutamate epimerase-like enolase superfamily enzyme